jgi:hypothetical protein
MPIVTLTENDRTYYCAVTDGDECRVDAVVQEYKLDEGGTREYVEHALQTEYLKRLTEHAYNCAQLSHFVENPPDDVDDLAGRLQIVRRLVAKAAETAVWLRTYDPFTGLTAEVVGRKGEDGKDTYGTGLQVDGECVSSLDDDSWEDTARALRARHPMRLAADRRIAQEKTAKDLASSYTPAGQKRVDAAVMALRSAVDYATKLKKRSEKTVANKVLRRPSKAKRARSGK